MKRRTLLTHTTALAGSVALPAVANPVSNAATGPVRRLGLLRPTRPSTGEFMSVGIPAALAEIGWHDGRNLRLEVRHADGQVQRLDALARELVDAGCEAIIAVGASAVRSVLAASRTVPVLMFGNFDPVAAGFVQSLARPGGNATGILIAAHGTLAVKRLELLREAVPQMRRVALLAPDDPGFGLQVNETRDAAGALGLELSVVTATRTGYEAAFASIAASKAQALVVGATTFFMTDRRTLIEHTRRHRLPAIWEWAEQVRDGGLMAYGTSLGSLYRQLAGYADQVLRGARPAEMPVRQPAQYDLILNARAARAIGLTLPQALLLRADEVIR